MRIPSLPYALVLASTLALSGCASLGTYTWYGAVPPGDWSLAPTVYVIAAGDVISVSVYDQPGLSSKGKIRSDGKIALPFVGEIDAAGKTPAALGQEIEKRLKEFVVSPRVTVNVDDSLPIVVSVLGEVGQRGNVSLPQPATVLQALAQAGGPTEFADKDAIFLVRQKPAFRRIRFTYDALLTNKGNAAAFPVRAGDVIVVQ